jgi:hypothetical protein
MGFSDIEAGRKGRQNPCSARAAVRLQEEAIADDAGVVTAVALGAASLNAIRFGYSAAQVSAVTFLAW